MPEQTYEKHARYVALYHVVLLGVVALTFIGSLVNLYESIGDSERIYSASLITAISVALLILFWLVRNFPLGVQDRVIRAEENMRHYVLTGKPIDHRLTIPQLIALRFAPDSEFVDLARRAADQGMSMGDIKKSIKTWRPDHARI